MPPKGRRLLALPYPSRTWKVAGSARGGWEWSFPEPEGKMGTEPRRERQACEDGDPHTTTAGKKGVGPTAPSPARPPYPRASASRRRKCCVAHFRVLSGRRRRRRRASRVSRPPPLPPRFPEPGATSPPWPASKVGLGRRAPEGWVAARERGRGSLAASRMPPPRPGRAPRRCLSWRPPPAPRPPSPPSLPGSGAGRGALREGPAGSAASPSAPSFC